MILPAIAAPGGFVPASGLSFATTSGSVGVDRDNPLPTSEPAFRGAVPVTVGTDQTPQRALAIVCTTAGIVHVKFADDSDLAVPVPTGLSILPFQVKTVIAAGTTAVASYTNLV